MFDSNEIKSKFNLDPSWPVGLRSEFEKNINSGVVGSRLVSESDRVRVWHILVKPGERLPVHHHVLDYFWIAVKGGRSRSHYHDGRTSETEYRPGDTKHFHFPKGEFMMHDLENIGSTELEFTTVEFLASDNLPLPTDPKD